MAHPVVRELAVALGEGTLGTAARADVQHSDMRTKGPDLGHLIRGLSAATVTTSIPAERSSFHATLEVVGPEGPSPTRRR